MHICCLSDSFLHCGLKNNAHEFHLKFTGVETLRRSNVLRWLIQDMVTLEKYLLSHSMLRYISKTQSFRAQLPPTPKEPSEKQFSGSSTWITLISTLCLALGLKSGLQCLLGRDQRCKFFLLEWSWDSRPPLMLCNPNRRELRGLNHNNQTESRCYG